MSPDESVMPMGLEEALYFQRLWNECGDAREFACRVLSLVMNAVMDEQAQLACGAARGERTRARTNSRNGYRPRTLKTATGDVELRIPKLREGSYFPEEMLTRWSRVDVSVAALVREMYVSGVSTRKVERVAERLGISSLSSSEVSRLCGELDAEVEALRGRDLSRTPCCYLWLDATYMSCREGSVVSSHAVVTAIGLGADGRKHVLGVEAMDTESEEGWNGFLAGLKARGLSGVRLVVSDAHAGLVAAIARQLQGCAWQRCITHLQRNLQSAMAGRPQASKECVAKLVHAACYEMRPGALQGDMGGGRALGREGLPQGGGDLLRRRGLGPRLPGVPRGPLGEAQDQQRPGEGEPGDQEALQGRPVLPLGRLDAAPERGLHPLGGGALGHPARLQRGVRRTRLQRPRARGGPVEGAEGGAGEEGRPDRRGDNRGLRPQEGVRFG